MVLRNSSKRSPLPLDGPRPNKTTKGHRSSTYYPSIHDGIMKILRASLDAVCSDKPNKRMSKYFFAASAPIGRSA